MGCGSLVAADDKNKTAERLDEAAGLFTEIMGTPDKAIPQDLLEKAHCIVLVPGLKKIDLWETRPFPATRQVRARLSIWHPRVVGLP